MACRVSPPGTGSLLPADAATPAEFQKRVERDYERFATGGLPAEAEAYLLDEYGLDVSAEYAGLPIRNPFGKGSGQLSMTVHQVQEDVAAGLGFAVLKTVIAQDKSGDQSMRDWAVRESRMTPERITSATGASGWTITWKGRGWWQSFEEYLELVRRSREIAAPSGMLIVPSCKYHLPAPGESGWRSGEYHFTTSQLLAAWRSIAPDDDSPMPIEKDFSPTLAGSDLATARSRILEWLHEVPPLIRSGADRPILVGLKLFNALFDDAFQVELLDAIHNADAAHRPDFFIYGNRLFNPDREFDGHRGVAYGGPDLSDRNLRVLSTFLIDDSGLRSRSVLPFSATGDIASGKTAVEYALRGASSFQLHTYFQLPADQYHMKTGSRTQRALHELYFHPKTGFVVWMDWLRRQRPQNGPVIRFLPPPNAPAASSEQSE